MCAALTLPPDLRPDEAADVDALVGAAREAAVARAALAVRVRREVDRLHRRGLALKAAFTTVADDPAYPVSAGTAEDIWRRRGAWRA